MMLSKGTATQSKSDRPENSVLFSLNELRRLEDERVKAEADARMAQADAERRAKAEAEERARAEETRRVREEEERRKRAESENEARQREDRFRLEDAERRARVEGELKLREQLLLEKERQRHTQGRRFGRSAWIAAAAGTALFAAVGSGLAAWVSRQHRAERKALELEIARLGEQARATQMDLDAQIRALEEKAHRAVVEAKSAKDQARILGDLQRQKQAIEAARPRPPRRTAPPTPPGAAPPKPPFRVPQKPEITDDPLGDLPTIKGSGF
jgi:hypothetical protein